MSALYHRVTWTPRVRLWMRRIDHSGVLFLIAGTYTPVCLFVLDGTWRIVVLAIVWAGALAGAALKFAWVEAPNWVAVLVGLTLGWVGVIVLPQLVTRLDPAASRCSPSAGSPTRPARSSTRGAGRTRSRPCSATTRLFHALTLVAVACQYVAIAFFVIPSG